MTSADQHSGHFQFVRIPADSSEPIESLFLSKEGGLSDDALIAHAKEYFSIQTGNHERAQALAAASPGERQVIAAQVRQQLAISDDSAKTRLDELTDDQVINIIFKSQLQSACDIMALTVPTANNNHRAVSLYSAESSKQHGMPQNDRATALVTACGHAVNDGIYGDVFVGRAHDDEMGDVWTRDDFTVADADPKAEWCRTARSQGGGGGSGSSAASSLSNIVQQQGSGNVQVIPTNQQTQSVPQSFGENGAPAVQGQGYAWTQDNEEVELKFQVPGGTKAKYCKVDFGRIPSKSPSLVKRYCMGLHFCPLYPTKVRSP
jgi:hypothetical protein